MKRFQWVPDLPDRPAHRAGSSASETLFLLGSVAPDGKVRFLNPVWEKVLGYDVKEAQGRPLVEMMPPGLGRAAADWLVSRLLDASNADPMEICLRARDGTPKRFLWHRRFDPHERVTYIVGVELNGNDAPPGG